MGAGHPDQVRLEAFLTDTADLVGPRLKQLGDPIALSLDVGLPAGTPILDHHDLDNYLFPLVQRLTQSSGRQFVSVWGTEHQRDTSYVCIARASPLDTHPLVDCSFEVRTSSSSVTTAYKQEINDQLVGASALPDGAVSLQLSFTVGPRRSWPNLWKPTIDALGQILGRTNAQKPWNPRDGRVVELGLHCRHDPTAGNNVDIVIGAKAAERID